MSATDSVGIEGIITILASGSASLNWLIYDGHGNVVRTVNTSFGLSAYQWRGVWGERQTPTLQTGKGYCANLGHQEDETGLIYMRARYYEPTTGRFISEDPARDGVNWYLYADGNAVNRVDFTGKYTYGDHESASAGQAELQSSSGSGVAPQVLTQVKNLQKIMEKMYDIYSKYPTEAEIRALMRKWSAELAEESATNVGSWVMKVKWRERLVWLVARCIDDECVEGMLITLFKVGG